jgi:DNA-binding MarR family transcriptional regulator
MHAIFFGLKRAYHGTLRITRRALAQMGLTAARFDLLYIVLTEGSRMLQRSLREALGVSAATVSRMLQSLEGLGLLEREWSDVDRRQRCITLTKEGRRRIRTAVRCFVRSGYAQLAVDGALCPDQCFDRSVCERASSACDHALRLFREAYGDVATTNYPNAHEDCPWLRSVGSFAPRPGALAALANKGEALRQSRAQGNGGNA